MHAAARPPAPHTLGREEKKITHKAQVPIVQTQTVLQKDRGGEACCQYIPSNLLPLTAAYFSLQTETHRKSD